MVTDGDCLVVTPRWNPGGGGRERYAAELVQAAGRRGVTMTVVTMADERRAERAIAAWRARRPAAPVLALEAVPDATHVQLHSGVLADSFEADGRTFPSWVRRACAPIGLGLNVRRQRWLRREHDLCADRGTRLMAFSHRDAASVRRRYGTPADQLDVLRPGIDLERFIAPTGRSFSQPVRALFAGHNFRLKGLAVALQSIAKAGRGITLTVVGGDDPSYYRRLARRLGVSHAVCFRGVVDGATMASLYGEHDVLLHPAIHDPFPRAVIEALACGCPVITTPGCGASEVLSHEKDGWVVDGPDTAGAIADVLVTLADPDVRRRVSGRAAENGRRFDFDAHVTDVLAWLSVSRSM